MKFSVVLGFGPEIVISAEGKIGVGSTEVEIEGFDKFLIYSSIACFSSATLLFIAHATGLLNFYFSIERWDAFFFVAIGYLFSVSLFSIWYAKMQYPLWMLQGYLTVPLLILMTISLFASDTYGSLLRVIRYGGGISTTIQLQGVLYDGKSQIEGHLLLRSDSALFVFASTGKSVIEVPVDKVALLTTNFDADWMQPNFGVLRQSRYVVFD